MMVCLLLSPWGPKWDKTDSNDFILLLVGSYEVSHPFLGIMKGFLRVGHAALCMSSEVHLGQKVHTAMTVWYLSELEFGGQEIES